MSRAHTPGSFLHGPGFWVCLCAPGLSGGLDRSGRLGCPLFIMMFIPVCTFHMNCQWSASETQLFHRLIGQQHKHVERMNAKEIYPCTIKLLEHAKHLDVASKSFSKLHCCLSNLHHGIALELKFTKRTIA